MNASRRTLFLVAAAVLVLLVGTLLVVMLPKVEGFGPQTIQGGLPRTSPL